jgi:hypothetical protein
VPLPPTQSVPIFAVPPHPVSTVSVGAFLKYSRGAGVLRRSCSGGSLQVSYPVFFSDY